MQGLEEEFVLSAPRWFRRSRIWSGFCRLFFRIQASLLVVPLLLACSCESQGRGSLAGDNLARAGSTSSEKPVVPFGQVTFPSGRVFNVDLALTWQQQARGYMGRRQIQPEEGMLFVYTRPGVRKFWMKNCLTAIDIIWLNAENRILYIEHSAPPCDADPCPSFGPDEPAGNVLEVAPGTALAEGLKRGDPLQVVMDSGRP